MTIALHAKKRQNKLNIILTSFKVTMNVVQQRLEGDRGDKFGDEECRTVDEECRTVET